jgi:long-chain acyl-CoA synthetase
MYIADHARETPDKPAMIRAATGEAITYRELDRRSNRFAQLLHARGFRRGDVIALLMENHLRYAEVCWTALRSGLYVTAINRYLTAAEAAYIVADSGARALVTSATFASLAAELEAELPGCPHRFMLDGRMPGWESYEAAVAAFPDQPIAEEWLGDTMLYSSGTTGRPKGIKRKLLPVAPGEERRRSENLRDYGAGQDSVYLSPAPLYHAAPLGFVLGVQFLGGTVVFMDRFDAEDSLRLIERYRVTHSQWVPTMFVRMLKLPEETRRRYDLSSHRVAIHAAAPCPPEVKRAMIKWWGPILEEYYAGTESNGSTWISSAEWLARPGSVGRAKVGVIHICDEDGAELPPGEAGTIYFEREEMPFEYHKDPEKTRAAQHPRHPNWSAIGDIGYLDEAGYLYITDRKAFMIISGGVNIYPRAVEDVLIMHPAVGDVAVIGVPDPEMGEAVKAVIEPAPGTEPSPALAEELIAFARERMARYMVPKSVDFVEALPRSPTGKIYKRVLQERYRDRPRPTSPAPFAR